MNIKKLMLAVLLCVFFKTLAARPMVNVYVWGGEIPKQVIQEFETQTGIKVNFSTYDSNETMYAKLKASRNNSYDVILPSAYYVERMIKQGLLSALNRDQLPNLKNLDPYFAKNNYDPGNDFSVPLTWGVSGIFYNSLYIKKPPHTWNQIWEPQWRQQLMLLDDAREVFSIALLSLGFSPNDNNSQHILAAYKKLLQLTPNIKLFASDSIQANIIDEDAFLGSAWNGDVFKAHAENSMIHFQYPQDGFVIWVDCLAIPKDPPHPNAAYSFINYMLSVYAGKKIALIEGHAITNLQARSQLPATIKNNKTIYPSHGVLKHGHFQRDLDENSLALINDYWQKLKLTF